MQYKGQIRQKGPPNPTVISPESQPRWVPLFPQAPACSPHKQPVRGCTHLDNAGHRRNKEGQDVPNFFLGNLKQTGVHRRKVWLKGIMVAQSLLSCVTGVTDSTRMPSQTQGWHVTIFNG